MANRDPNKVSWDALFVALDSVGMTDAVVGESASGEVVIYTRKAIRTDIKGREYLGQSEDM